MILISVWGMNLRKARVEVGKLARRPLLPPRSEMAEAWPREVAAGCRKVGRSETCCSGGTKRAHGRIKYEK